MDFAVGVYLSETQGTHPPPTLPLKHCIPEYSILIRTGKVGGGGRVEPERKLMG
jgi:hypothetical protein